MSNTDSLFTKLKNKVTYRVKTAVDELVNDPEANAYAKEHAVEALSTDTPATATDTSKSGLSGLLSKGKDALPADNPEDKKEFSISRIFTQVWNYILIIINAIWYPVLVIILSMVIANESIMYAAPIRFVFYVAVIVICTLSTVPTGILSFYYLCKAGYGYYLNNITDGPKQRILPPIFALLPLFMNRERPWYARFFLYPFTYPKTPKKLDVLKEVMDTYYQTLNDAFPFAKKLSEQGGQFKEEYDKAKKYLDELHELSAVSFPESTTLPPVIQEKNAETAAKAVKAVQMALV